MSQQIKSIHHYDIFLKSHVEKPVSITAPSPPEFQKITLSFSLWTKTGLFGAQLTR